MLGVRLCGGIMYDKDCVVMIVSVRGWAGVRVFQGPWRCGGGGGGGGDGWGLLSAAAYHAPRHWVSAEFLRKPVLHSLHMAAPFVVQAAPVLGEPLWQVHVLADTHTHTHTHKRGSEWL